MPGIGDVIRVYREARGMSQAELSGSRCAVSTLSRIENGEHVPSRGVFIKLMEGLGLPPNIYPSLLNESDKKAFELEHEFNELYAKGEYEEAEKTLNQLETMPGLDKVYEQDIRAYKLFLRQQKGLPPAEAMKEFEEIINSFIKDFAPEKIKRVVLHKVQINILNAYAAACHETGDADTAIKILRELDIFIGNRWGDLEDIAIVYTKVLYRLSRYVGITGDDEEAVALADKGIKICQRYDRFTAFSSLLYNKGYGLMRLGRVKEAHKCIQDSYFVSRALGKYEKARLEFTQKYAEKMGIPLL